MKLSLGGSSRLKAGITVTASDVGGFCYGGFFVSVTPQQSARTLAWAKATHGRMDKKCVKYMSTMVHGGGINSGDLELISSIYGQYQEKGFLTEPQRQLILTVRDRYKDSKKQADLIEELKELAFSNRLNDKCLPFVSTVSDRFIHRKYLTRLEQEQLKKILHEAHGVRLDDVSEAV